MSETDVNGFKRKSDGTFDIGTAPGPGRPEDTPEKKLEKKALKVIIEEYREKLAESLPLIEPVLVAKALESDVQAIKEIHDRVMGKSQQNIDVMSGGEKLQFNVVSYKENGDNDSTPVHTP